jgi:ketosteroid isomerase-like protein
VSQLSEKAKKAWNSVWTALQQQFNCTLFVTVLIFWYLARDKQYFVYFVCFEVLYLVWIVGNSPLKGAASWVQRTLPPRWSNLQWQPLLSWGFLALFILLMTSEHTTFWGHPFIVPYVFRSAHEKWEIAALTWNLIFSVISYVYSPLWKSGVYSTITKSGKLALSYAGVPLMLGLSLLGTGFALSFLAGHKYRAHLWCVLAVAFFYAIADWLIWRACPAEKPRYLKVLLYADLPTVAALGIFLLKNLNVMNTFISGVIAFQFIANSFIFALIEGGVFEARLLNPKTKDDLKTVERSWAQTIEHKQIDAFMDFLQDDGVRMWLEDRWIEGKSAIKSEWEKRLNSNNYSLKWTADSAEVSKDGGLGYTHGVFRYSEGGKQFAGNYATVWQRSKNGEWRLTLSMALPMPRSGRPAAAGAGT